MNSDSGFSNDKIAELIIDYNNPVFPPMTEFVKLDGGSDKPFMLAALIPVFENGERKWLQLAFDGPVPRMFTAFYSSKERIELTADEFFDLLKIADRR